MPVKPCTPLTKAALAYTWRQLAQRVGVTGGDPSGNGFEALGVPISYARSDQVQLERAGLIVLACSESAWLSLLERAPISLDWVPVKQTIPPSSQLVLSDSIPVLFWAAGYEGGGQSFVKQREDGSIVLYADVIAATFFMLSRWEETVVSVRDQHDRFPATASVAYKQGFLDRPVIDEYALILREWLKKLIPGWPPSRRQFSIKLTHDIDDATTFPGLFDAARALGGDLIKRRSLKKAWHTVKGAIRDPHIEGIYTLAKLSHFYGMDSAFFFMAAGSSPQDAGYDPASPLIRGCIEVLRQHGFEIGFHAGYHTLDNPDLLAIEKARLDTVLGDTHYGGRQHYLRFTVPNTWRHWEQLGLDYDATMGYADHEGFRCGTCHQFQPFDLEQNRQLNLWEHPLIVMDATLRFYQRLQPEQCRARILKLFKRCQQVEGTFTLLWHNSSLNRDWGAWTEIYQQLLKSFSDQATVKLGNGLNGFLLLDLPNTWLKPGVNEKFLRL